MPSTLRHLEEALADQDLERRREVGIENGWTVLKELFSIMDQQSQLLHHQTVERFLQETETA